jgi:hypothetical protein
VSPPATSAHPLNDEDVAISKLEDKLDAWSVKDRAHYYIFDFIHTIHFSESDFESEILKIIHGSHELEKYSSRKCESRDSSWIHRKVLYT